MDWAIILVVYATLFIATPIIVTLHELGHAFAYLVLTKPNNVDVYVGSYGLKKNTLQFRQGKINFYVKTAFPIIRGRGLCKSDTHETNPFNYIIILLAGPVFTLLILGAITILLINLDLHVLVTISCYILLVLSCFSLLVNLIPMEIGNSSNTSLYNDGKQILFTLRIRKVYIEYVRAYQDQKEKDYTSAIVKLTDVLKIAPRDKMVLKRLIGLSIIEKDYNNALLYLSQLQADKKLLISDLLYKGNVLSATKNYHEAIETYDKVLKQERHNLLALNNIGFALIEQRAYHVAKKALEKAIKLSPKFSYPYSNLGYSYVLQGNFEEAKPLLDKGIELSPEGAFGYKYLGLYYLKLKDVTTAKTNFNKAIEIDNSIDLSEYADELKQLSLKRA